MSKCYHWMRIINDIFARFIYMASPLLSFQTEVLELRYRSRPLSCTALVCPLTAARQIHCSVKIVRRLNKMDIFYVDKT